MATVVQQQQKNRLVRFFISLDSLNWMDALLRFAFRLTAKGSELLLAVGVILSTANHFQHGALFSVTVPDAHGATHLMDTPIFDAWAWMQAIGFEASAGVVFEMSLDANRDGDRVKRNVLLWVMAGLAFVGTVMLIMALVESSTGISESDLPPWYGVSMAILRGVVSVAYVTVGRVKHRRFSGTEVLPMATVPNVLERLEGFTESVHRIERNTEDRIAKMTETLRSIEANTEYRILRLTESLERIATSTEDRIEANTESVKNYLAPIVEALQEHAQALSVIPGLSAQLGQIEESTQCQWRIVTEEVTRVKVSLEEQTQALPKLAERIVNGERGRIPEVHRIVSPKVETEPNRGRKEKPNPSVKTEPNTEFNKGEFVRSCLTEDPNMSIGDIQRKAQVIGRSVTSSYISETRKAFRAF